MVLFAFNPGSFLLGLVLLGALVFPNYLVLRRWFRRREVGAVFFIAHRDRHPFSFWAFTVLWRAFLAYVAAAGAYFIWSAFRN